MYISAFLVLCIFVGMILLGECARSAANKSARSAVDPVISSDTYIGPNTDGYKYYGSSPVLAKLLPLAHRYDVDERASLKFWDEYARIHGDYTYSRLPEFSNDDYLSDPYVILN